MCIDPDLDAALAVQSSVARLLGTVLRQEFELLGLRSADPVAVHPSFWALAYRLRATRLAPAGHDAAGLDAGEPDRVLREARESAERAQAAGCPLWRVDLAPPGRHLAESLERALSLTPRQVDIATSAGMHLAGWGAEHRRTFCAAACLLAEVWPEVLAEMRVTVQQVVLLTGHEIGGFSDFGVHGAVFLNARRLSPGHGLPAMVRLAETLVHEAAHTICNAAAVVQPLLRDGIRDGGPRVMSPLRTDPRPLTGLLQQLVVLTRCLLLCERLIARSPEDGGLTERRRSLHDGARSALDTAQRHAAELSDHGLELVAEAQALVARSAAPCRG